MQSLKKSFGEKKAVRDITFKVEKGEILGLLGPNGAGKTTSLSMVTAEMRPDKGEVRFSLLDNFLRREVFICVLVFRTML